MMSPEKDKSAGGGKQDNVGLKKRDITDTEGWKNSTRGAKRFWTNYKAILASSFNGMSRDEQEKLIERFAVIITIGVTTLVLLMFYSYIPRLMRVFGTIPLLFSAWWAARRIVAPVVIERMENALKRPEPSE